jgi:hypothetical protein
MLIVHTLNIKERTLKKGALKMKRKIFTICLFVILTVMPLSPCSSTAIAQEEEKATPIKGFPDASLTIFPLTVFWSGLQDMNKEERAWADAYERGFREDGARPFAQTLGLLLEEKGYDKFEIADTNFELPSDKATREKRVAAFGKFVSEQDLKTDYALYTEFVLYADKSGIDVYSVIADANGHIAWEDSPRHAGTEFGCLELACKHLAPVMGLDKLPKKEMAEDKKRMLRKIRAKEPPSVSEREAMEEQLKTMKQAGASAGMLVYPARVGGDHTDPNCATHLSELINEAKLCKATAAKTDAVMEGAGWPNEMHVLWLFARNVREYVREHPADSDYVLFADYWFNPRGQVWAVHFVVCDKAGNWVIADLQNSHQEAFQRINPKNLEDCDRLVLDRLKTELR